MSEPKGTLYLVPTPIGNLEDMTYRAVRVLQEVHTIAAEDTRHSGLLLKHFDIKKPLVSYHEHNKEAKEAPLMEILFGGRRYSSGNSGGTFAGTECSFDGTYRLGA